MSLQLFLTLSFCWIAQGYPPPKNLRIEPDSNRSTYTVEYDPVVDGTSIWYREYVFYNIEIHYNGKLQLSIWTPDYGYWFPFPDDCTNIDAYVAVVGEDGIKSEFAHTSYYTGATEILQLQRSSVHSSRIKLSLTYRPMFGQENCPFIYEIQLWYDGTMLKKDETKELVYEYEYVKEKFYCKVLTMMVTPKLNGIVGSSITLSGMADHLQSLTPDFDMGPPSGLSVDLNRENGVVWIEWSAPVNYETCATLSSIKIYEIATGATLVYIAPDYIFSYKFDYASKNVYCTTIRIEITSTLLNKETVGGTTSTQVYLPC